MFQASGSPRALSRLAGLSLTLIVSAAAATAATAAEEGPPPDLKSAPAGTPAPSAVSIWSLLTSEELPPLTAFNGYLISAMRCNGDYCDNVALGYEPVFGSNHTTNGWTSYFSEEGTNWRTCDGNGFMTGISCQGSYCDNVSLQCSQVIGRNKGSCAWQPWFSEEAPAVSYLPQGYYAAGLACRGSYCDDLAIFACQAL
jgi:hypothetical protein